jgi:hypothetical protein
MRKLLDPGRDRYPVQLVDFLVERLQREIEWLDGLKRQVAKEGER